MSISGPYYVNTSLPGLGYTRRTWYRQRPVSNAPLPFKLEKAFRLSGEEDANSWATRALDPASPVWTATTNRCYQKLVGQIGSGSSAWAANLATWKQSHGMIVARATQLLQVVRALKRGQFSAAASVLGIRKPKKRHANDLAGQWLELSYGWVPLIQDIHNSVNILQGPLPPLVLRAHAFGKTGEQRKSPLEVRSTEFRVIAGARLVGIHPGALLANQLGLVNPATVAWEVVPFSFVIDWFIPVGTFLQSFTDFVGVRLDQKFTTDFGIHTVTRNNAKGVETGSKRRVEMVRRLELPKYKLRPRFTGFYSMRGANAIALLIGGLKSLK